jgi:hypothetical protein
MIYAKNIVKNIPVPIKLCFVETGSSLGTGINENMSTFFKILIGIGAFYSFTNVYLKNDLELGFCLYY